MLGAADTVGVFQVESRAQMQTLPKSKPANLDDLVVEVAIIRPGRSRQRGPSYLRRRQGLEPVAYLHPSLEPVLHETSELSCTGAGHADRDHRRRLFRG